MPNHDFFQFITEVFKYGDPRVALSVLLLFMARILPIVAMSPFLGARILPNPTKIMIALCLFGVFLPQYLMSLSTPLSFNLKLVLLAFKELFVGLAIGFMMSVPFIIVQAAGMFIDHQRGGASLMVNDPTIQNQSSPIGQLFNFVLIYLFFTIDGPFLFFEAIFQSYAIIPPDQFINPAFSGENSPFWGIQIKLFNEIMKLAVQIASPALIAILMTDVFLGIANRLAPQVQITFLGLPLKSLLGLSMLALGWNLLTAEFVRQCYKWLNIVVDIIKMFTYGSEAS